MPSYQRFALATFTVIAALLLLACETQDANEPAAEVRWLAGDHHIHSRYSTDDSPYPIPMNALMAQYFGLSWTVATDHGGPNHSKIRFDNAYPELELARTVVPEVIQFYGLELNTPGADHSSIIMPHTSDEAMVLRDLESRFDKLDQPSEEDIRERDRESLMIDALQAMDQLSDKPVVFANHPARNAPGLGDYGLTAPHELRNWNDTAPDVAVGMEGAPGHQAGRFSKTPAPRGWYFAYPTMGGYDQMTARLGGFWDSMLGEGRRWWITANSDSHRHYTDGPEGVAFWPGEYAKTYVHARKEYASILEGLRGGRIFVTTGDLVSELEVDVTAIDGTSGPARIGGTVVLSAPGEIEIRIRARDPRGANYGGDEVEVARIDLISGLVTQPGDDRSLDTNASTAVVKRFSAADWQADGEFLEMRHRMNVSAPMYVRVRGTNTDELEPAVDPADENPWQDLWFYSNPVFVEIRQ